MARRTLGLLAGTSCSFAARAVRGARRGPGAVDRPRRRRRRHAARPHHRHRRRPARRQGRRPATPAPGDSAAGALERATAGSWGGTWNAGFGDYERRRRSRARPTASAAAAYWGFFLNGDASPSAASAAQKLQAGDERAVRAARRRDFDPVGVLTLERRAGDGRARRRRSRSPSSARRRCTAARPTTRRSTRALPVAGATVALPGGGTATTGADGKATITLTARGPATLRATQRRRRPLGGRAASA